MTIWERVLYERLKHVTKVDENQFGFMAGKSTIGAIFIIRQLQEKYLETKRSCATYLWTWKKLSIRYQVQQSDWLCVGNWFQSP